MQDEAAPTALLAGKRVLLIVAGGIAAYKALELVRRLRENGANATAVLTAAAQKFVAPLSFASLTGQKVYDDLFSLTDEAQMGHIQLSRENDFLLVVPATADLIAKAAGGHADDLASTLLLASDKFPIFVPAMNVRMWTNPATQRNVAQLTADGAVFFGPTDGEMACGEYGPGRMIEPHEIIAMLTHAIAGGRRFIRQDFGAGAKTLTGRRALVTAGPTREKIDPVRYLSNYSSGKQGFAIARALAQAGAQVALVSGPADLATPPGVQRVDVQSAQEMLAACRDNLPADIFVAAAAVADWRVASAAAQKTKKDGDSPPALTLVENPDILAAIGQSSHDRPKIVVGFAAETENLIANARRKLERKGCDLIVANNVGENPKIFGGERNTVAIIDAHGEEFWPESDKAAIAAKLVALIARKLSQS